MTAPQIRRGFTFLVNPSSGGGAAPEAVVPVARLLRDAGATVDVTYSPGPRAMAGLVAEALGRGDVVVSVGGDGMLSSLAGAVSVAGGTLGGAPGRSRQRLRPDARPARRRPTTQAALLLEGDAAPRRPDVADRCPAPRRVGSPARSTAGVDARAAEIVDRAHWLPRKLQYPYAALRSLATYQPGRYRVTVDGVEPRSTPPPTSWSPTPATTARA